MGIKVASSSCIPEKIRVNYIDDYAKNRFGIVTITQKNCLNWIFQFSKVQSIPQFHQSAFLF